MDNVISLVVWAKLTDFTADLTFGSCFVKSEVNLKSPWQPRYPYHLISLPSTGCFEELGLSYKGFSLVRLVIKTNREHSTFTGVSFSFYLPLCQHTHLHLPPHFSQHCLSCILPKFNFCSTSVSTIFFFFLFAFLKSKDTCSYLHLSEMGLSRLEFHHPNTLPSPHRSCPADLNPGA